MKRMMIRKFVPLCLLTCLLLLTGPLLKAQLKTNLAQLQKASAELRSQEKAMSLRLLQMAKEKGWARVITNKSGRRAILSGIDPKGYPLYIGTNDISSGTTIRTNQLWPGGSTGLNLSGSSNSVKGKLAVWDEDSVSQTHQELVNRVLQKDHPGGLSDHSTHVSGIMMASGVNPSAKGMSFGLQQLIAYDFNNHLSEMSNESPNLLASNHSYGTICGWNYNSSASRWEFWGNAGDTADYKFGYYSTESQVWDSIAYNAPYYLIVKSVGNSRDVNGPAVGQPYYRYNASGIMTNAGNRPANLSSNNGFDVIPTYGGAKNILSVGAVNSIPGGYNQPSDAELTSFSSWGPTDDGRIKPDVVADGVDVLSSIAAANDAYAIYSGTSMSSPAAAGSSILLQEYYAKLHSGTFMRSATLKGIIIHTADETGVSPGPDYQYGWGLIDMAKAASVITSNNTDQLIIENNLINGATFSIPVVASGKGPLVATISWTDPAATVETTNLLNNPARKLVNDLDLRITSPDSLYMPWILDPANPTAPATTGDNVLDNVEKIDIPNAVPGQTYTVKVSHKATLARGQQAYSLLVSGVGGTNYCASGPSSTAGSRIDSVNIGAFQYGNPAGCTGYTDLRKQTIPLQANQANNFSIKLSSCDVSVATKVAKIFIDYNNNGSFADAGENVAVSGVVNGNGYFTGSFTTPLGLAVGNYTIMRIVLQETNSPAAVTPCGTYPNGETEDFRVQIVQANNDVGIVQLVDPQASLCATDSQRITVRIKNFGDTFQVDVPITTILSQGNTVLSTQTIICPDTIPALGSVIYTFQAPFAAGKGNSYTVTSFTAMPADQDTSNDRNVTTIQVSTGGSGSPGGSAEICGNTVSLQANSDSSNVASWYAKANDQVPLAVGNQTATSVITANKTYYVSFNDIGNAMTGPASRFAFPSGGYNEFAGNFVNFYNSVPLVINSARMYIAHAGKIQFIVADIVNYNPANGSYSYYEISSNTIDVYPTTPDPQGGAVDRIIASDTGAVFYLNLPVPTTGKHAIIIVCQDGANIFRNNNISSNPYPFSVPGVFSITGNSAVNTSNTADTTFYRRYYYFFYNLSVTLTNCPTSRVAVVAKTGTAPVISLVGQQLTSSIASGNQWYLNDTAITGATGKTQDLLTPGKYTDTVRDASGCVLGSNVIVYSPGSGEIGLSIAPNPNKGVFNLQFFTTTAANVNIAVYNAIGQRVYSSAYPGFSGFFSKQINVYNVGAGVYFVQVLIGSKSYVHRILIE